MKRTSEAAFETAIESVLLGEGYTPLDGTGFDRERAIFPDEALAFIRATQAKVWEKLDALHGELSLGVGYRIGDLTRRGTVDHYRTGDSNDEGGGSGMTTRPGRGTRVGGALRYSFANAGEQRSSGGLGADFWGEVGLGLEHVAWRQGGVLDRPSASLAVGYELDGQGERGKHGRRRHIGYIMAFRTFVAQGPEMDGPAVCGGPCSQATKPSRTDLSMLFELGLHWGR